MIKIVVDLLGADKPQTELVLGAIRAISVKQAAKHYG